MKHIVLCKQPAVLRRSALSRIEKARARTLKMTIVIGKLHRQNTYALPPTSEMEKMEIASLL